MSSYEQRCGWCRGFGYTKGSAHAPWEHVDCVECGGTGNVPLPTESEPERETFDCLACGDTGYVVDEEGEEDNCPNGCPAPETQRWYRCDKCAHEWRGNATGLCPHCRVGIDIGNLIPAPETPSPEVGMREEAHQLLDAWLDSDGAMAWNTVQRAACDARDAILAAAKETK